MNNRRVFFTSDWHLGHRGILLHCYASRSRFMTQEDRDLIDRLRGDVTRLSGIISTPTMMDPSERSKAILELETAEQALSAVRPSKASVKNMDECIIANMNSYVGTDDTLICLGDTFYDSDNAKKYREAIKVKDLRNVWGNHDKRVHTRDLFSKTYDSVTLFYYENGRGPGGLGGLYDWEEVESTKELRRYIFHKRGGNKAMRFHLNHYAQAVWWHSHKGVAHLYGHSHGNLESWRHDHMPNACSMDVGVDVWDFYPIEAKAAYQMCTTRPGKHVVDHHGDNSQPLIGSD